jgi:hypothetical protein
MRLKLITVLLQSKIATSIIALFFCLTVEPTQAQERSFKPSIYAGLLTSQVSGDNLAGFDKFGFLAGSSVEFEFENKLFFEVGLQFIQKGSRQIADPANNVFDDYLMRLNYIEAPFLIKYNFYNQFIAIGGITFGGLVSSREEGNGIPINDPRKFYNFELGYIGGIGYRFNPKITVVAQYHGSITKIRNRDSPQSLDQRHEVTSVVLKYSF